MYGESTCIVFFLSLSSFSAGGILYLFTDPFHLLIENYWLMIVGAIIISSVFALCLGFFFLSQL